jgi:hypothetical protein
MIGLWVAATMSVCSARDSSQPSSLPCKNAATLSVTNSGLYSIHQLHNEYSAMLHVEELLLTEHDARVVCCSVLCRLALEWAEQQAGGCQWACLARHPR